MTVLSCLPVFLPLMQSEEQRGWAHVTQGRKGRLGQYRSHASLNIMGSRPQTFGCQVNTLKMATVWGGGQRSCSCPGEELPVSHQDIVDSLGEFSFFLFQIIFIIFRNFVLQNPYENLKYFVRFFFPSLLGYWPFAQRRRDVFLGMMKAAASILAWAWGLSPWTSPWVFYGCSHGPKTRAWQEFRNWP